MTTPPGGPCQCRTVAEINAAQRELIARALVPYPASLTRYLAVCAAEGVALEGWPIPTPDAVVAAAASVHQHGRCRFCGSSLRRRDALYSLCPCRVVANKERARRGWLTRRGRKDAGGATA